MSEMSRAEKAKKGLAGGTKPGRVSSIVSSRAKEAGHGKGTMPANKGVLSRGASKSKSGGKKSGKGMC
jgi:hypothetical protein